MTIRPFATLLAGGIAVAGCSLIPFPTTVTVSVRLPTPSVTRNARGPALSAMKCFAVIVKGASGAVTSAQTALRSPACLGLDGAFYGPFTYEKIISGVSLTLPASNYHFSIVGFNGIADCGTGPASLYANGSAETYLVASPQAADLRQTNSLSLSGETYVPASTSNRTVDCPPLDNDCTNSLSCDRFVGDSVALTSHTMDVGSGWSMTDIEFPNLIQNEFSPTLRTISTSPRSYVITAVGTRDVLLRASMKLGQYAAKAQMGLIARTSSITSYALGAVERDDNNATCSATIIERSAGVDTVLATLNYTYPDDCPTNSYQSLVFTAQTDTYRLTYRGRTVETPLASPNLTGDQVGFSASHAGNLGPIPKINFFRAQNP